MTGPPPLRLLVVDDSAADRELMREAVNEYGEGIDLLLAATVAEARVLAAVPPPPQLALVDLHLGRESGNVLARSLGLPVVILSTTDDPDERHRSAAAGARDFWIKPLRFEGYRELLELAKDVGRGPSA